MSAQMQNPGCGAARARELDRTCNVDHSEDARLLADVQLTIHARDYGRRWDVLLDDGERIVDGSRDPEHDAARVLIARGIAGKAVTIDANTGKPRLRLDIPRFAVMATVERAAGGLRAERWRSMPSEISAVRSQSGNSRPEGSEIADGPEQASVACRRSATA